MLRWVWSLLWELGWYMVLASGWVCWWKAHQRAQRLSHERTVMAASLRYAARYRERSPHV